MIWNQFGPLLLGDDNSSVTMSRDRCEVLQKAGPCNNSIVRERLIEQHLEEINSVDLSQ